MRKHNMCIYIGVRASAFYSLPCAEANVLTFVYTSGEVARFPDFREVRVVFLNHFTGNGEENAKKEGGCY